jgi:hypothetical protein
MNRAFVVPALAGLCRLKTGPQTNAKSLPVHDPDARPKLEVEPTREPERGRSPGRSSLAGVATFGLREPRPGLPTRCAPRTSRGPLMLPMNLVAADVS